MLYALGSYTVRDFSMYTGIVQGAGMLYIKPSLNVLAALSPQGNPSLNIICRTIKHGITVFGLRGCQ